MTIDEYRATVLTLVGEDEWKAEVMRMLRLGGWEWFSIENGMRMNTILDIVAWRERLIHVELKKERGKLTKDRFVDGHFVKGQETLIPELEAAGQEVYVWHPHDHDWARWVLVDAPRREVVYQPKEQKPDEYRPQ